MTNSTTDSTIHARWNFSAQMSVSHYLLKTSRLIWSSVRRPWMPSCAAVALWPMPSALSKNPCACWQMDMAFFSWCRTPTQTVASSFWSTRTTFLITGKKWAPILYPESMEQETSELRFRCRRFLSSHTVWHCYFDMVSTFYRNDYAYICRKRVHDIPTVLPKLVDETNSNAENLNRTDPAHYTMTTLVG